MPDDEFLNQPSWEEAVRVTQYRMKDVTDMVEVQFGGVVLFSAIGIVATIFSFLAPTSLNLVLIPIDSGVASLVFFAFLLERFSAVRKTTFDLFPPVATRQQPG